MIEVLIDPGQAPIDPEALRAAAEGALSARDVVDAEISLALLDDGAMRVLNRDHLGHDRTTDVLSFALWEPGDDVVVGDVYVGWEQALRQAADEGVDPAEELMRLTVHGVLHVTGLNHPAEADRRAGSEMYRLQESIVRRLVAGRTP